MMLGLRYPVRLFFALSLLSAVASAEPTAAEKKRARVLMEEGDDFSSKRDYNHAIEKYEAAHALMGVPTTGIEVARTLVSLGKLVEARDVALKVTRLPVVPKEPEVFTKARQDAQTLADQLVARIPSIEVVVKGAAPGARVQVRVDGKAVPSAAATLPQKLDPGRHEVVVAVPGQPQVSKVLTLAEGARETVEIDLAATQPGADTAAAGTPSVSSATTDTGTTKKTSNLVYIGFGAGALGLAVGSVTGLMSMSKTNKAKDQCDGNRCPSSAQGDIDSAKTLALVSNIGFGVAIVGVGVGVYGLLTPKQSQEKPVGASFSPVIGTRYLGLSGSFR